MSNNTSNVSTPIKGMNTDVHPMNLGEQGYDYALNAVVEEFSGNGFPLLQNEASNLPCTGFPSGYYVIGYANVIEQQRILLFLTNPTTGVSEIGEIIGKGDCDEQLGDYPDSPAKCDDCGAVYIPAQTGLPDLKITNCCTYSTIISGACFGFSIDHPIRVVYRIEACNLSIYFTDGLNPYRYLMFDYLNDNPDSTLTINYRFKVVTGLDPENCDVPIYSNDIDCNKLLLDPALEYPCISLIDVVQGGQLVAGMYQFVLSYADESGLTRTPYFPATNPIPIFTRQETVETNYVTDKAILLAIANIDFKSAYLYYNVAVIKTINEVTSFEFVGTYPISTTSITYTGTEKSRRDLTEGDIFAPKVYYSEADIVASSNNFLFFAGLTETDKLNVQRISNNVKTYWQTAAIPEPVYRDPKYVTNFRSYLRDEVYALGLVLIYNTGEESVVGHIPGPSKAYFQSQYGINVDTVIANDDIIDDPSCADDPRNKMWQVYNTAQLIYTNPSPVVLGNCDDNRCYQYGDFAYWESIDTYPNRPDLYGDLCGQPIRHHKMPDSLISHIHDGLSDAKSFTDKNIIFPLGIRVDTNSVVAAIAQAVTDGVMTQAQADRIVGYRIVRGNRFGRKSIIAKGLLYDVWKYNTAQTNNTDYYYANYPFNSLQPDPFISNSNSGYAGSFNNDEPSGPPITFIPSRRYTFHSPDTSFLSPSLGDEVKIETEEYGTAETYFNYCLDQAKEKMLSAASYSLALAGGIVAMLIQTEPKTCTTYTITADVKDTEDAYTIQNTQNAYTVTSDVSGTAPYGNVTGVLAEGTGDITTIAASSSWSGSGTTDVPDVTGKNDVPQQKTLEVHSTSQVDGTALTAQPWYDPATGINTGLSTTDFNKFAERSGQTCQGTPTQIMSGLYPNSTIYNPLILAQNLFNKFQIALSETNIILDLIKSLTPYKNYGIQANAVGIYNNYKNVANSGFKRRKIETYSYLKPEMSLIDENTTGLISGQTQIHFNNWNRESSIYLKTLESTSMFPNPTVTDASRFDMDTTDDFSTRQNVRYYNPISSYYASMKNYVPDQYGNISDIEYIDIGNCIFFNNVTYADCQLALFGGDTFINRFSLKRKQSFFLNTTFRAIDGVDIDYTIIGNVGYPRYFYETTNGIAQALSTGGLTGILTDPWQALGRPNSYLDCKTLKFFYQNGVIYLYNYGIPYFLVESDIDVDFRTAQNNKEFDFYPHTTDLSYWLQERNVPPSEDNYFFYNFTYSKQNKEHFYGQYPPDYQPERACRVAHPNRIIYSNGTNWLNYKPNDFYDFPLSNGALVGVDGIENDKVLVRSENTTQVFNAYITIPTNTPDNIQVGTGGMFASKPQEYAHTTLGYAGTQSISILHTEYGHIWVDSKRGQVFNLSGEGLDEISKNGMKNWFKENLPFQLLKDFPTLTQDDIDNNFKGIGIVLCFDKRFNRFLLTKLDYKVINESVQYDPVLKEFYIIINSVRTVVSLNNIKYFCNKSWTISYNFFIKAWVSFHSFMPNYYIEGMDYYISGFNGTASTSWIHNETNKSYQVFNGKLYPFTVQTITKPDIHKNNINSIEYGLDVIRYHNEFDPFYSIDKTFNKAVVFTQNQNSGYLDLNYHDKRNLNVLQQYPIQNVDSTSIRVTNSDGIWRINTFYDIVSNRLNNMPIWTNNCANTEKQLNQKALDYQTPDLNKRRIRGEYSRVRLTNDKESNYKFIFKWLVNNTVKTYR